MKGKLETALSTVERIIELTSCLPEDTSFKLEVKGELIKRLEVILEHIVELEDYLDSLGSARDDD